MRSFVTTFLLYSFFEGGTMREKMKKSLLVLLTTLAMVFAIGMMASAATVPVTLGQVAEGYGNTQFVFNLSAPSKVSVYGIRIYSSGITGGFSAKLYNSQGKGLDIYTYGQTINTDGTVYYGLKAGQYTLSVEQYDTTRARIMIQADTWKDLKNNKKSKATTLKKGKTVKSLLAGGEKGTTTDWYKFKITKKKKIKVAYETYGDGILEFTFFGPSIYKGGTTIYENDNVKGTLFTRKKVRPGTYYLRVRRNKYYKNSNWAYSLKLK